ncbi:MAG: hypothetical protein H7836_15150 [Magnetococcus sp. YQC-3]
MPNKSDTAFWDNNRGLIRSRKGGWIVGDAVYFHNYSLTEDLFGKASFMQVMVLNATGRLPDKRLGAWFEASFLCAIWPDSRIWCNQIGAFGGTVRTSPVAATVAGTLAADSMAYGPPTQEESLGFILRALQQKREGIPLHEIVDGEFKRKRGRGYITGYSRPVASGDIRIPALERVRKRLAFKMGPHLKLAFQIGKFLSKNRGDQINTAGYLAGFLADHGFTPEEMGRIYAILVSSGVLACYADARDRPADAFLPLRCSDIHYAGKPHRPLP